MNFIDKTIQIFSPDTALQRERSRQALRILKKHGERRYEAASRGRRVKNWNATSGSANTETGLDLHLLRNRSRDLVRNNTYAKKAIEVIQNNMIGSGILLSLDASPTTEKRVMKEWRAWAETTECDFDGRHNFYGLQSLAMRAVAESGECIIRRRRKSSGHPIQLQVCEPDFIDTSKFRLSVDGSSDFIIQGVHFDKDGRRTGYWLYDQNPYDTFQTTSKFVPVDEVIHLYSVERPGQVRGVPWGASAIIRLRNFDEYEDAQLVRQKIAACFSVFVQDSTHADSLTTGGSDTEMLEKVEPGIIEHVPPGRQVVFGNPPGVEGYNEYATKTLQAIAAGYGVTYEALTGDLSGVNFSSGRMGWLEFYRNVVHAQQHIIIPQMCDRSFDWFTLGLELKGTKFGPLNQSWTPPRREMIDPVKETKAMVLAIRNGLMSYAEAVRQFGGDPDLLLEEIKKYQEKFDEMEITLDSDPRRPNPEGATNNREPSEPNE